MLSRGNSDTNSTKRKSDVSKSILITKTVRLCLHSVALQPSDGASVDEYEWVQNEISYETTYYSFLRLCNLPTFKLPDSCS